jgi:hypothetical protein
MFADILPPGTIFDANITSGPALAAIYGDPTSADPVAAARAPDVFIQPNWGTIYSGSNKIAEHGGGTLDDRQVALLVSHPAFHGHRREGRHDRPSRSFLSRSSSGQIHTSAAPPAGRRCGPRTPRAGATPLRRVWSPRKDCAWRVHDWPGSSGASGHSRSAAGRSRRQTRAHATRVTRTAACPRTPQRSRAGTPHARVSRYVSTRRTGASTRSPRTPQQTGLASPTGRYPKGSAARRCRRHPA